MREVNLGNSQPSINLWAILNETEVPGKIRWQGRGQSVMGNSSSHAQQEIHSLPAMSGLI